MLEMKELKGGESWCGMEKLPMQQVLVCEVRRTQKQKNKGKRKDGELLKISKHVKPSPGNIIGSWILSYFGGQLMSSLDMPSSKFRQTFQRAMKLARRSTDANVGHIWGCEKRGIHTPNALNTDLFTFCLWLCIFI